jgi:hypothetical protein
MAGPVTVSHRVRLLLGAASLVLLAAALAFTGCGKKASDTGTSATASGGAPATSPAPGSAQRFSKSSSLLLEALTKPADSFHFSFKGQTNLNNEYPREPGSKPKVGPVATEADISPTVITVTNTRGEKTSSGSARKENEADWAMSGLAFIGPMTDISMAMAFASPAAHVTGTETVNGMATDRYEFNTDTASPEAKAGIEAAKKMLGGMLGGKVEYGTIRGTVCVDQASGRLVKFNIDAEVHDKAGNSHTEHMEGEVSPKK